MKLTLLSKCYVSLHNHLHRGSKSRVCACAGCVWTVKTVRRDHSISDWERGSVFCLVSVALPGERRRLRGGSQIRLPVMDHHHPTTGSRRAELHVWNRFTSLSMEPVPSEGADLNFRHFMQTSCVCVKSSEAVGVCVCVCVVRQNMSDPFAPALQLLGGGGQTCCAFCCAFPCIREPSCFSAS